MKKGAKHILFVLMAIGVNVAGFTGISAYLTSWDGAQNTMTVGHSAIDVLEEFIPPDKLEPGAVIPKKVNIENTGETPCAVRVSAEFSRSDMEALAELDIDWKYWEKRSDGYYYYKEILDTGDITHTLFNTVTIDGEAEKSQLNSFEIMVYAESVNAEREQSYSAVQWK